MINWKLKKEDIPMVDSIAARAVQLCINEDKVEVMMDVTAVHLNDVELDLDKLLNEFDDFNFAHDINGIRGHIDVNTGKLRRCFLPRCAR